LLNPYVQETQQIRGVLPYPIIGEIPHNTDLEKLVIKASPNSHMSEAFRSVRAKLNFFLQPDSPRVIAITSSLSGEGKSFSSVNLASLYAISGKRTVVIGADMRRPALGNYFVNHAKVGLSNYLVGNISYDELVQTSGIDNLYYIAAGEIPPNPYELIAGKQFSDLVENRLKQSFDIIIIDTSPLLLVSDALPIIKHSDLNILLVRHGKTYIKSLEGIKELVESQQVQNFAVLFNDLDTTLLKYKYGYKYKYKYNYYYKNDRVSES
jgi:capsular exopolysaccharide synthesis family protein